jgi:hypothetical protein
VPEKKHVLIVTSPRPRVGKTLLARVLAAHLSLTGDEPKLFDTDAADRRLTAFFPGKTTVVDLERVPDQMKLFDTLAAEPAGSQIIDLTHRSFGKFFRLMHEIGYVAEGKARGIETVVFYIPDSEPESYELGLDVRTRFPESGFVLVKNAALGEPSRDALNNSSFMTLAGHSPVVQLRLLDPFLVSAIEDVRLSLSEFARRSMLRQAPPPLPSDQMSLAYLSLEARNGISAWLHAAFAEIRRALRTTDLQADIVAHDRFGV